MLNHLLLSYMWIENEIIFNNNYNFDRRRNIVICRYAYLQYSIFGSHKRRISHIFNHNCYYMGIKKIKQYQHFQGWKLIRSQKYSDINKRVTLRKSPFKLFEYRMLSIITHWTNSKMSFTFQISNIFFSVHYRFIGKWVKVNYRFFQLFKFIITMTLWTLTFSFR